MTLGYLKRLRISKNKKGNNYLSCFFVYKILKLTLVIRYNGAKKASVKTRFFCITFIPNQHKKTFSASIFIAFYIMPGNAQYDIASTFI